MIDYFLLFKLLKLDEKSNSQITQSFYDLGVCLWVFFFLTWLTSKYPNILVCEIQLALLLPQ